MDRDELIGIAVGFEREGAVADRFREITLAQDVPADPAKPSPFRVMPFSSSIVIFLSLSARLEGSARELA
jgi:hypothetical protein